MSQLHKRPQVLVLSGLDPSGGAGIQADIQAITALGCHPLPVLSCLTVQSTVNVFNATPVDPAFIKEQLDCLAGDVRIDAVKTGALGNAEVVQVLVDFLKDHPELPVIVDPVIKAAGGGDLADDALIAAMKNQLFPMAEMITPNGIELEMLGEHADPDTAAQNLLKHGCKAVLATGGHSRGEEIVNTLYHDDHRSQFSVERVGGEYHGTGCTLAASISAGRAAGLSQRASIAQAQNYVLRAIRHALAVGQGQPVPDRGIRWES